MHGEYKVPGGKLVMADVEVADGQLARVSISGDFFLEPDSALEIIDEALTGMPVNARVPALAAAIDNALDDTVEMVGFDAHAVAIAVRRALGKATGWGDHEFEVIGPEVLDRSEEHTSELQSRGHLVCRLLLEKKKRKYRGTMAGKLGSGK